MAPKQLPIIPDSLLYEVKLHLKQRKKIDAIRRVREETNMGLADAKLLVESIESGDYINVSSDDDNTDTLKEKLLILENQKENLERRLNKPSGILSFLQANSITSLENNLNWVKLEIAKIKDRLEKMGVYMQNDSRSSTNTLDADKKHSVIIHNYGTISDSNIQGNGTQNLQSNALLDSTKQEQLNNLLYKLSEEIISLHNRLPEEVATHLKQDFDVLNTELKSKSPRKQWYELSINGLMSAAKKLGEIGKPILELAAQILLLIK